MSENVFQFIRRVKREESKRQEKNVILDKAFKPLLKSTYVTVLAMAMMTGLNIKGSETSKGTEFSNRESSPIVIKKSGTPAINVEAPQA